MLDSSLLIGVSHQIQCKWCCRCSVMADTDTDERAIMVQPPSYDDGMYIQHLSYLLGCRDAEISELRRETDYLKSLIRHWIAELSCAVVT